MDLEAMMTKTLLELEEAVHQNNLKIIKLLGPILGPLVRLFWRPK